MRVTIEKLVYGGAGLARTDRGVVFVPRTAPGDVAEVELTEQKADYAVARIVAIEEPSPDRQSPYCPSYETAGCCHWQHIRYSKQLEIKESILRETLRRIGRISWDRPIRLLSGPDRGYRLRATFHVREHRLGFLRERTHTVVPISGCSALVPELNHFIPQANTLLAREAMASVREVRAVSGPPVAAAFISEHGQAKIERFGEAPPRITVNEFAFEIHPDSFFQSNRYLLDDFMREVLEQACPGPRRILDLFCGSGFFSIPLARRAVEVLAVDSNPVAVRQGRLNAKLNRVENVRFFEGEMESMLQNSDVRPDLVVLNPPRSGCGRGGIEAVAGLKATRIVYVSCNPSTFAREAQVLAEHDYRIEQITLIDQFPNTYHIELAAQFELN